MAGLVDLNGLESLSSYSVRIQDMEPKKTMFPDDVYLIAEKIRGAKDYVSKNVTYDTLSSETLEEFRTHQDTHEFTGLWNFNKHNFALIDTFKGIENAGGDLSDNVAVNLEYLYKYLLPQIYALSIEIYGNPPHLPSFIGQIVTSSKLSSINEVKAIYGQDTEWEQIEGKFLCGIGKIEDANNMSKKYGTSPGEYEIYPNDSSHSNIEGKDFVELTEKNLPKHTHRFSAQPVSFENKWSCSYGNFSYFDYLPDETWFKAFDRKWEYPWRCVTSGTLAAMSVTFKGETSESTASLVGSKIKLVKSNIDSDGKEFSEIKPRHNNMPPFITKYCWKRVQK